MFYLALPTNIKASHYPITLYIIYIIIPHNALQSHTTSYKSQHVVLVLVSLKSVTPAGWTNHWHTRRLPRASQKLTPNAGKFNFNSMGHLLII